MGYKFSIVRLKKKALQSLAFPADLMALPSNPLAGPFDGVTRARMLAAIARCPGAQQNYKESFEVEAQFGGRLEIWFTPDGFLFVDSQAGLELLLALFVELANLAEDIALEDSQRGLLHGPDSFAAWLHSAELAAAA